MVAQRVFSSKENKSVEELGDFLIHLGQRLKNEGSFSLDKGDEKVSVKPMGSVVLDLKYEIEKENVHEFEIELKWNPQKASVQGKVNISWFFFNILYKYYGTNKKYT